MKDSSKSTNFELVYKDKSIRQDGDFICLTDLWAASGKPSGKRDPSHWKLESGQDFIDSVAKNLNIRSATIYKTTRGRYGASWGHWQIALAYAKYLSPEL
ncbi:MAG: KilA-N domain-containing protein, partial [Proteobacteria bacterium]|nr:KilA-N domain-containing protein [Pseudomonadota bacterium]